MGRAWLILVLAACESAAPTTAPPPKRAAHVTNTQRGDYIGPAACGDCHPDEFARWSKSLHRVMNAKADEPGAVIGNFATSITYRGRPVVFAHDASGYTMTTGDVRYRVTRTIGRRGLQEYVGIEDGHTEEVRLPFGWWPRHGGWAPQVAFDPWLDDAEFDPFTPVREPWAERCPWCHSTYPFAQRIARAATTGLGHGLEQLVATRLPAAPRRERLAVDEQVTTGISCESCHLGGRAHADGAPIHFTPDGAPHRAFDVERKDAAIVNTVCAQCHSGPSPRLPDGTALRNSSEAIDLAASPCTGIKCTDCHDPHRGGADEQRAIAACTGCHEAQADPSHAGHTKATCLDCHMPKIVMGIDHMVRTHRISSPTDPRLYALGAPNACSLCHLDRSLAWTAQALHDGWDVTLRVPADDRTAGEVYLSSKTPAFRLIAAQAGAHATEPETLPYMRAWLEQR